MSSSTGRILTRQIKPYIKKTKEGPPVTLFDAAREYLSRTDSMARWKNNAQAFNRTTAHRTVALKFVEKFDQADEE